MAMKRPYGVNHGQTTVLHIEYQLAIEREVFFSISIIINEGTKSTASMHQPTFSPRQLELLR